MPKRYVELTQGFHDEALELLADLKFDKRHPWHRTIISLYGSILELSGAACILMRGESWIAVPILLRSMMEAYVDLSNLCRDRTYGYYLDAAEEEHWVKVLSAAAEGENEYLAGFASLPDFQEKLDKSRARLKDLKTKLKGVDKIYIPLRIKEKFKRANMSHLYDSIYAFLCCDTHNNPQALMARHVLLSADNTDFDVTVYDKKSAEDFLPQIDFACWIIVDSTALVHNALEVVSPDRIEFMKQKLLETRAILQAELT